MIDLLNSITWLAVHAVPYHRGIQGKKIEFQYQMTDDWVKSVDEERDIEVMSDLKFSKTMSIGKK